MPAASRSTRRAASPPAAERPRTRTADVRAALVDAAWWVLQHDGLAGLTVRAVATRAGVAPMGVYNHLHGKDGLLTVVVTRGFDELTATLAHPAQLPPAEGLPAAGRAYRAFALAHPVAYGLMFGGAAAGPDPGDGAGPRPETLELRAAGGRAFGQLVAAIRLGQAAGMVRDDPAEQLAWTVWSAVHGAVSLELASEVDPAEADPNYEHVLRMVSRGLAP